jgi:hypothetical protein
MAFHLHLRSDRDSRPSDRDRRPGGAPIEVAPEMSHLIVFSRGVVIGFISAFVVFDWALMGGLTTFSVLRGAQHVVVTALHGW